MIEFLFKSLIVVILLVILIPLIMLLFGEGALAGKLLEWSCGDDDHERIEMVEANGNSNVIVSNDTTYYYDDGSVEISQSVTVTE